MERRRTISIIFSPDGGGESISFRLRSWQVWVLICAAALGWVALFCGAIGALMFAKFAANHRALVAENIRLRSALAKADSLQQEIEEIHAMRALLERALLAQSREKGKSTQKTPGVKWGESRTVFVVEKGLPELAKYIEDVKRAQAYIPMDLPVQGVITAGFGKTSGIFKKPHTGVDISVKENTPVQADGIVCNTGNDEELGIFVELDHLNGYHTLYAHLSSASVSAGEPIRRGEIVGYSGKTGHIRHPHLHYEVIYRGEPVDPLKFENKSSSERERDE